jgi:hypothetical protein
MSGFMGSSVTKIKETQGRHGGSASFPLYCYPLCRDNYVCRWKLNFLSVTLQQKFLLPFALPIRITHIPNCCRLRPRLSRDALNPKNSIPYARSSITGFGVYIPERPTRNAASFLYQDYRAGWHLRRYLLLARSYSYHAT